MKRSRSADLGERVVEGLLLGSGVVTIVTTLAIVGILVGGAARFFSEVPLRDFVFDTQWTPLFSDKHYGIWPLVAGTAWITGIAMAVALPVGLLVAIFLAELVPTGVRRVLKPTIEVLAGIPTVVFGFFALAVVTPGLQGFVPGLEGFNALGPGLVVGVMIIPTVASVAEDALAAVPRALREAAWGLGSGRARTILTVVVPAARSGLVAAAVLGVARAVGETMIVAMAAGMRPVLTADPREPVQTLTAYIVQVSLGDTPAGSLEFFTIFAVGTTLFALTLALNVLGARLARRRWEGA